MKSCMLVAPVGRLLQNKILFDLPLLKQLEIFSVKRL